MKIKHTTKKAEKYTGDMVAFFVHQQEDKKPACSNKYIQKQIDLAYRAGDFSGKEGEAFLFYPSDGKQLATSRALVVGLGKAE